jgi:hypothetical protein
MKLLIYANPVNLFQIGWNAAIENPVMSAINLPSYIGMFDMYDFLAGFSASIYKHNLPENWLS